MIHQGKSKIHLKAIAPLSSLNVAPPWNVIRSILCQCFDNTKHGMKHTIQAPVEDPKIEAVALEGDAPVSCVPVFVINTIVVFDVDPCDGMGS